VASPRREELALFRAERAASASKTAADSATPYPVRDLVTGESFLVISPELFPADWTESK
jgi:hypothetical protein